LIKFFHYSIFGLAMTKLGVYIVLLSLALLAAEIPVAFQKVFALAGSAIHSGLVSKNLV